MTTTTRRAHVTYFPFRHGPFKDEATDYEGDVIEENNDWIVLNVWGSNMTFSKDRVLISAATSQPTGV